MTNEELAAALRAAGHADVAEALARKVGAERVDLLADVDDPTDIRRAAGRGVKSPEDVNEALRRAVRRGRAE